jgi:hypothetical protein
VGEVIAQITLSEAILRTRTFVIRACLLGHDPFGSALDEVLVIGKFDEKP